MLLCHLEHKVQIHLRICSHQKYFFLKIIFEIFVILVTIVNLLAIGIRINLW